MRRALADALSDTSKIVFTHNDLSPRNIIVVGNRVKGLLDWEYAGWYPEYWEFVKFFERPTNCKGWKDYAGVIFEREYPQELITFQALARWQKP
jgi:thiamine kinase-like enzyme